VRGAPSSPAHVLGGRPGHTRAVTRAFRQLAVVEAVSWLLLIVATIVKYAQGSQTAVHILGPVHGALFVGYVVLALLLRPRLRWGTRTTLVVLVESVLPGGGFLAARRRDLRDLRGPRPA